MGTLCHSYPTSPPLSASLPRPPSLLQRSESQRLRMWVSSNVRYQHSFRRGLEGGVQLGRVRRRCHCPELHLEVEASSSDLSQVELKSECKLALSTYSGRLPSQAFLCLLRQTEEIFFFPWALTCSVLTISLFLERAHFNLWACLPREEPLYIKYYFIPSLQVQWVGEEADISIVGPHMMSSSNILSKNEFTRKERKWKEEPMIVTFVPTHSFYFTQPSWYTQTPK